MIGSPSNLELLIHCHVSPEKHPRGDAPAIQEGLRYLEIHGMIERYDRTFTTTPKGKFYLNHLMGIPFPETTVGFYIPEQQVIP